MRTPHLDIQTLATAGSAGEAAAGVLSLTVVRGTERLQVDCIVAERPALPADTAVRHALAPAARDRAVGGAIGDVRDRPVAS